MSPVHTLGPACFLAPFARTSCDGRLVKAHLIPKRHLKAIWAEVHHGRNHNVHNAIYDFVRTFKDAQAFLWDERSWRWACGGPMGNGGHHHDLDFARTIRLPRSAIPEDVEQFASLAGLGWWIDREYGERPC